jgi:FtsZ-binding cell division protein ZapB
VCRLCLILAVSFCHCTAHCSYRSLYPQVEAPALSPASALPPRPMSQEETDARAAIGSIPAQIEELKAEIRQVKAEKADGWQVEVAALREETKQLQEEKNKLRDELVALLKLES